MATLQFRAQFESRHIDGRPLPPSIGRLCKLDDEKVPPVLCVRRVGGSHTISINLQHSAKWAAAVQTEPVAAVTMHTIIVRRYDDTKCIVAATTTSKEHRSPEQEEARSSPTPGPPSPLNNGTAAALSSTESLSPPLAEGSRSAPALQRLRKFLSALQQFATDVGADTGERVRQLIHNLVSGTVNIEEFQAGVQECTNYPLRASVPGFLRALLPLAQRDLHARARRAKQTPLQYIRSHEHLILESGGDSSDIFAQHPSGTAAETGIKRRASDP
ncbi:hypothetical protein HF086_017498 [Spodoptera exigua]|uniref:TAFH domain-containing protein n=1 Tax=Spodoptera exigua TaxID=7107 RepID=A0A922M4G7_SPOEX|nr:hypothetical protein HF086_017498 [Spodoptera exigua]